MKMSCLPVLLLLLLLPIKTDCMGHPRLDRTMGKDPEHMPYFNGRKKWLADMNITLYPRQKKSKTDARYFDPNLKYNPEYTLSINEPDFCTRHGKVFLLIMFRTHFAHYEWRAIHREVLNRFSQNWHPKNIVVRYLFIFGKNKDPDIEKKIESESRVHRDIIQGDFEESYINLIKKVPLAWYWAVNFCPNAEFVMINNDETFSDIDKVIPFLLEDYGMGRHHDHFALCYPLGNAPVMHDRLPQFLKMDPKLKFAGPFYPPYCHGWGYVAHIVLINQLHKALSRGPTPFMPTDVYIGVLAEKLRINFQRNQGKFFISKNIPQYFANPRYPVEEGMVAITDEHANKGRELEVFQEIVKSMRRHWSIRDMNIFQHHIHETPILRKTHSEDCSYFNFIHIYTMIVLFVLLSVSCGTRSLRNLMKSVGISN